jgi:hypothetical protein
MFGRLLGLRSFDIPKGPLVCKQTSLPITFDGGAHIDIHHRPNSLFRELGLCHFNYIC